MEYHAKKLTVIVFECLHRVNSLLTRFTFSAEIRYFASPKFLFLNPHAFFYFCSAFGRLYPLVEKQKFWFHSSTDRIAVS